MLLVFAYKFIVIITDFMSADSGLAIYGSSFLSLDGTRTSNAAGVDGKILLSVFNNIHSTEHVVS